MGGTEGASTESRSTLRITRRTGGGRCRERRGIRDDMTARVLESERDRRGRDRRDLRPERARAERGRDRARGAGLGGLFGRESPLGPDEERRSLVGLEDGGEPRQR